MDHSATISNNEPAKPYRRKRSDSSLYCIGFLERNNLMRPSRITIGLGILLIALGIIMFIQSSRMGGVIPFLVGCALVYLGFKPGRVATLIFGHTCVVVGAYLITWGIILLPYTEPKMAHIFGRPLFWGIFSLMGGVCAIFHGFCRCVTKQVEQFEGTACDSPRL